MVLAAMVVTPALAQTVGNTLPLYDGSGSYSQVGDKSVADAKYVSDMIKYTESEKATLRKAALSGGNAARVAYATLLEQGRYGVAPDLAGAFDMYQLAADNGDVLSREKMCLAYLLGEGRPRDLAKGMSYCNKLSEKDATGQFSIAYDYDHGVSGPADKDMAMSIYAEAGKTGSGDAMAAIGQAALTAGKPDAARAWFRRGVVLGSGDAMDGLAALFESGTGGSADASEAYWLYANAARRGNAHAMAWLAARPSAQPVQRIVILGGQDSRITQTVADKAGTHVEPLDVVKLGRQLADYYPTAAVMNQIEGSATVHCYVNTGHEVDVCLLEDEAPQGYGFGNILLAIFNGKLDVAETDDHGLPTANGVFVFNFAWKLGH